jgi:RNA polymerase sigma-70 factor (ECF subfamily)
MRELETTIIQKAIAGDKMAFRSIVIHYGKIVNNLAYRYTHNETNAEDISQETFIKAFKALPKYKIDAKFSTWLFRITTNASIDYLRKTKNLQSNDSIDQTNETSEPITLQQPQTQFSEQLDLNQQIHNALDGLTETERMAFTMKHHQGFTIQETANRLKINNNACKQTIYRAVQKLRKQLTPMVST